VDAWSLLICAGSSSWSPEEVAIGSYVAIRQTHVEAMQTIYEQSVVTHAVESFTMQLRIITM
ncbi:hypothetical protein Dimus_003928, partial [Dionaea muscipula]